MRRYQAWGFQHVYCLNIGRVVRSLNLFKVNSWSYWNNVDEMVLVFWIVNSEQILAISTIIHFLSSSQHSWCWLVHSQQQKHQISVWNLFNVNNNDTRTTSLTFSEFVSFEQISYNVLVLPFLTKCRLRKRKQQNDLFRMHSLLSYFADFVSRSSSSIFGNPTEYIIFLRYVEDIPNKVKRAKYYRQTHWNKRFCRQFCRLAYIML